MKSAGALTSTELAAWAGLLAAHRRLVLVLDAELEQATGLSLSDYDVLLQLAHAPEGRLRMSDLAQAVLLTRSGLTRLVDRLQERGLVERVRCPGDGRGLNAVLTDAGRERLSEAAPHHLAGVRRHFLDRLAAADVERLGAIWRSLADDEDDDPVSCDAPRA